VRAALWTGAALATLAHLAAPFPYDDYQVFVYPAFAAGLACVLAGMAREGRMLRWVKLTVASVCVLASAGSPMLQDWFVGERDRIWWPIKTQTPLGQLRAAAREIRQTAGGGEKVLLTQDPYLAVEAGMDMPRGLELGPFSYFPDWPREKAEACHVLNRDMLRELLDTCEAPVAAFSGYGLAIRCPEVMALSEAERDALWEVVMRRYALVREIPAFGQAATTLRILRRSIP
jgi:hypothetical protein